MDQDGHRRNPGVTNMGFSLGGYSGDLTLDETNQALSNSGSTYQLQQPELGSQAAGGSQYDASVGLGSGQQSAPVQSAPTSAPVQSAQTSQVAPPAPGQAEAPPPNDAAGKASMVGGLLSTDGGENKLGKVLNIVANIYGGGAATAAQGYNAVKK